MRKVLFSVTIFVLLSFILSGCFSKPVVDISMDEFCNTAITEFQNKFDNFGDKKYEDNNEFEWLNKYSKYNLNENQQEYYNLIKDMYEIFLDWQEAKIDNRENSINTNANRMSKKFQEVEKFINNIS